jgi:hypothetical protein
MASELSIIHAHPFQFDAVVALTYRYSSSLIITWGARVRPKRRCAVFHAAVRLRRSVAIVDDPKLSVGVNQPFPRRGFLVYVGIAL